MENAKTLQRILFKTLKWEYPKQDLFLDINEIIADVQNQRYTIKGVYGRYNEAEAAHNWKDDFVLAAIPNKVTTEVVQGMFLQTLLDNE